MHRQFIILFVVSVVSLPAALRAHHAFAAEFDASKPFKIRGTIVKMEWINPHTWLHLDVKRPDGKTERWMIEGRPAQRALSSRLHEGLAPARRRTRRRGLRAKDGSLKARPRADIRGRQAAVRRIVGHRRAQRREGTAGRQGIASPNDYDDAGSNLTMTAVILSRPPASFACATSVLQAASGSGSSRRTAVIASLVTMSVNPSEHSSRRSPACTSNACAST